MKNNLIGNCYNISIDKNKVLLGWFLIVSENGDEYLVQRNSKLSYQCYRNVYKTAYSFQPHIMNKRKSRHLLSAFGLIFGLSMVRIFRNLIPMTLFFGEVNRPVNLGVGLINVAILFISTVLSILIVRFVRKKQLEMFLHKNGAELIYIGKVQSKTYVQKFPNKIEVW